MKRQAEPDSTVHHAEAPKRSRTVNGRHHEHPLHDRDRDNRHGSPCIGNQLVSGPNIDQLPARRSRTMASVPAYSHFRVPKGLPTLPEIPHGSDLATVPFTHKSSSNARYDRTSSMTDITYERLEFLGDAYIELIASRLIFERYFTLTAGQQSQLRELLVKNETLAEYSRAYGFDALVDLSDRENVIGGGKGRYVLCGRHRGNKTNLWIAKKWQSPIVVLTDLCRGNKGINKIMGDVFEAYVAALILSDPEDGFSRAEEWLTHLWAPKLLEAAPAKTQQPLQLDKGEELLFEYSPTAKATIQKRIMGHKGVTLAYEPYARSAELKGDQLGQSRHFIALYLTGYGHERKLLGKGEGRNKVEAGNWAATRAMFGDSKAIVDQCEIKMIAEKKQWLREKEARAEKLENSERSDPVPR